MNSIVAGQVLLKESYVKVTYRADGVIVAEWKGYLTVEHVGRGCELMSTYIRDHQLTKHLSDHSELKILGKEVQEYLSKIWFNEVDALGLKKIAVKLAEDIFAQATVKKVNTQQKYGDLVIDTFGTYTAANKWLSAS